MAKTNKVTHVHRGNRTVKTLACSHCGEDVPRVDINAIATVCSKCVNRLCSGTLASDLKPRGKSKK
jgi:formylmethanofuran dehydrogenase subunit E